MSNIISLFDPRLTFESRVEKVITFSNRQEDVLQNEARDYVLTDDLVDKYDNLLDYFEEAQSGGGPGEQGSSCCVWLSGFYGSGKSSFAKYFGLSFDPSYQIEGKPFREVFTSYFDDSGHALKTRFNTLATRYKISVFLLDLASQGNADVGNTPISTLLFDRVCEWAGFPSDRKIADLMTLLERDDKLEEFKLKFKEESDFEFEELFDQPAVLIQLCSTLANHFYPKIWTAPESFYQARHISSKNNQDQVKLMLDLIKKKTGSSRVMFVIDEAGHFLRSNDELINNLDGLAKNIKELGGGHAWLLATAQQTLDMTPQLHGLKARFPIDPDLKSKDIREITYKRLLRKSTEGQKALKESFAQSGQLLVNSTKLKGCEGYPELNEETFINFYPLLPQQFELLINAIASLGRRQGGVGLRPAIRCIEEMLMNATPSADRFLDEEAGKLLTIADVYDTLSKDIKNVYPQSEQYVEEAARLKQENSWEHKVAKGIAVMQLIEGFNSTKENLGALLHPEVNSPQIADQINQAVEYLKQGSVAIPVGETDGKLSFLSDAVQQVEGERGALFANEPALKSLQSDILKQLFTPQPRAQLKGTKRVESGLGVYDGNTEAMIAYADKDIQFLVNLSSPGQQEPDLTSLLLRSQQPEHLRKIYLNGIRPAEMNNLLEDLFKCEKITELYSSNADQEVQNYLQGQIQQAQHRRTEIRNLLKEALADGYIIYNGEQEATRTLSDNFSQACGSKLGTVAEQVFDHYDKASINVPQNTAEKFLNTNDIAQITSDADPLGVVIKQGTESEINLDHPALSLIIEVFDRNPTPLGKNLLNEFTRPPYGWNKETTRYLLAALFKAEKIKLKSGGDSVTVVTPESLNSFRNNTNFNSVSLALNLEQTPLEYLVNSAKRLKELTNDHIPPTRDGIAKAAREYIPHFQREISMLQAKFTHLGIDPERISQLSTNLADAMIGDGAEAVTLFGAPQSDLYEDVKWMKTIGKKLEHGAEFVLKEFKDLGTKVLAIVDAGSLPGIGEVWEAQSPAIHSAIKSGEFTDNLTELDQGIKRLQQEISRLGTTYLEEQRSNLEAKVQAELASPDFAKLTDDQKTTFNSELNKTIPYFDLNLDEVLGAPGKLYRAQMELDRVKAQISALAEPSDPISPAPDTPPPSRATVKVKTALTSAADLDALLAELEALRSRLNAGESITIELS